MPRYASSAQIRAARGLLGWTVVELAAHLGMSRQTVSKLELGDEVRNITSRERLQALLESYGIRFLEEDRDGGEGVRFNGAASTSEKASSRLEN